MYSLFSMIINTGINSAQLLHAFLTRQCTWNKKLTENLLHSDAVFTNTSATVVLGLYNKISTNQNNLINWLIIIKKTLHEQ